MKNHYFLLIPLIVFSLLGCKKKAGNGIDPDPAPQPFAFVLHFKKDTFLKDRGLEMNQYKHTDFEFYRYNESGRKINLTFHLYPSDVEKQYNREHLFFKLPDAASFIGKGPSMFYIVINGKEDTFSFEILKEYPHKIKNISLSGKKITAIDDEAYNIYIN